MPFWLNKQSKTTLNAIDGGKIIHGERLENRKFFSQFRKMQSLAYNIVLIHFNITVETSQLVFLKKAVAAFFECGRSTNTSKIAFVWPNAQSL